MSVVNRMQMSVVDRMQMSVVNRMQMSVALSDEDTVHRKQSSDRKQDCYYQSLLNRTTVCSRARSQHSCCTWFWTIDCILLQCVLNIHQSGVLSVLFDCYVAGAMWNCCHLSAHSVYTTQPCTSLQCHFMQSHMCRMHLCSAVTCHLYFARETRIYFHATAVTWQWNGYWNQS